MNRRLKIILAAVPCAAMMVTAATAQTAGGTAAPTAMPDVSAAPAPGTGVGTATGAGAPMGAPMDMGTSNAASTTTTTTTVGQRHRRNYGRIKQAGGEPQAFVLMGTLLSGSMLVLRRRFKK